MSNSELKIGAAYLRVSTDDQLEYSLDAQLVEIRRYAAANGYIIPNEHIYVDEAISGKRTVKREAFNRMIGTAKLKPKPFDAILLWKYSRFARSREDSIVYKSMLRKQLGIDVISISEPVGDDKMSVIIEALIEAMDEYYSLNLAEEVKRGMTEKARRGGLQSTPSFGYTVKENHLVPVDDEAALVRSIFDRFIAGEGLFPIAKWLNNMGVTTHRGNKFENRTVEYILRNPVYIGKLRWNPEGRTRRDFDNENIILADAEHEPLISMETWDATQSRMAKVKAQWRYHGRPLSEHRDWISGLVRCSECGCTLIFSKPHYWKCNGYTRGRCKSTQHISDDKLKGMIISVMERDLQPGVKLDYTTVRSDPSALNEAALLAEQVKQVSAKLSRLREAYLSGVEDINSYATAKSALEEHRNGLSRRIDEIQNEETTDNHEPIVRRGISDCVSILSDHQHDMSTKHTYAHDIISECVFSKDLNLLKIKYRIFLP